MSWRADGRPSGRRALADRRPGGDALPAPPRLRARRTWPRATRARAVQEELCTTLMKATAAVSAGIAAAPIPSPISIPLTTLQASLVAAIAWIAGRGRRTARARSNSRPGSAPTSASRSPCGEAVRAFVKVIAPGGGAVVSATIAFSGTMAIGSAARAYYIRGLSFEEARRTSSVNAPGTERAPTVRVVRALTADTSAAVNGGKVARGQGPRPDRRRKRPKLAPGGRSSDSTEATSRAMQPEAAKADPR